MSIKDDNLKVDKTIFGKVKKVNTTLYVAENSNGTEANLINAYTNKILMNLEINRYVKGYKKYGIYKLQYEFIYAADENGGNYWLFDMLGKCILMFDEPLYYLPITYKMTNGNTIIALSKGYTKNISVIYVYDNKQFKLVKRIGNIATLLHVGKSGLKIIYTDEKENLLTETFELDLNERW